jgi:hypothetical protein
MVMEQTTLDQLFVPGLDRDPDAPTIDQILTLKRDYQEYYNAFLKQCHTVDDYYFGLNSIPAPEGHEAIKTALARQIVNIAADHVDVNNLAIEVPSSPRSRARAEKVKQFYQGVWMNIKGPVLKTAVKQTFHYGISFLGPGFLPDRWPNPPILDDFDDDEAYRSALKDFLDKREMSFALDCRNLNPKKVLWDDSRSGMKWAIFYESMDPKTIRRRYPDFHEELNGSIVDYWEYWDEFYVAKGAGNNFIEVPHHHNYGFLPFIPVFSANGMDWDDDKPEKRYQGVLVPVLNLLDNHSRIMTAYESILRQYAWPTLNFTGPKPAVDAAITEYELSGSFNSLPTGVTVAASPMATPPQELLQFENLTQNLIEGATFPNVVRGVRPRGVSSGFAVSVLAGMGRLVFQGVADGLSRAIEQCNAGYAKLIENKIRGKITVHARSEVHNFDQTIGPDDVKNLYENVVALKAEAPEEREREALLARQLFQAGIISLYEAQRRVGIVNPLQEQVQQTAERLMLTPEMQQAQATIASERLGLLSQFAQAAGEQGTGIPGAGGNAGQFPAGLSQLQRPGEGMIQRDRAATNQQTAQASTFPRGQSGIDLLGGLLGSAPGGGVNQPNGMVV